eukprot:Phypoly_transcript_02448.p1 GENE.Phypoly_transcript_02448~~Phypoly_transcript_02448.p1  ORF type:complete len:273 (+),score=54.47 Phypoly_transcript_02448:115-933(+)
MNLQDLLIGIDERSGRMAIRELDSSDEEFVLEEEEEEDEDERGSPMQVVEYPDGQPVMERIKLACVIQDLGCPAPASKKQASTPQDAEKKYPCRYCGERYSTNYMLGNHVSRKHRHLSKIFKPQKPSKSVVDGQPARKRGRPRKYPLAFDPKPSPATAYAPQVPSFAFSALPLPLPLSPSLTHSNEDIKIAKGINLEGEGEAVAKQLVIAMDVLQEFENSRSGKQFGVFERSPLFTSKLVALRSLMQARDLGLISLTQYHGKQQEFLHSFIF